jgi:predicted nucleic acid-binding protein
VLSECARVLATKLQAPLEVVEEALAGLPVVTMSEPKDAAVAEARAVVRDAGDAPVLAAAWQAGVDALVTGDKDLHAAQQDRVRVLRTNEALALVAGARPPGER